MFYPGAFTLVMLDNLQRVLGVRFNDSSLLEQALVHSSYLNENPGLAPASNERLEFLGDAVLGMVFAEKLYRDFPDFSEGDLSKLRSDFVCSSTLASIAGAIELGDYLYLGKGEEASGGRSKPANLAGAMEAVIAAVYLDQGENAAVDFILRVFGSEIDRFASGGARIDYKTQLQHLIQSRQQETPVYITVDTAGPDHAPMFTVEVRAGDVLLAVGSGKSKKLAEAEAARLALAKLKNGFTP